MAKLRRPPNAVSTSGAEKRKDATSKCCGFSVIFLALLGATVIILCNWLIDVGHYVDVLRDLVATKANLAETEVVTTKRPPQLSTEWISVFGPSIRSVKWTNSSVTMTKITEKKQPVLIKGANITSLWPMFTWDLLEIDKKAGMRLNATRWQPESVFTLGRDREKGGMIGSARDHPLTYTNVTLMQFLMSTFDEKNYLYWAGELFGWEDTLRAANMYSTIRSKEQNATGGAGFHDWRDFVIRDKGVVAAEGVEDEDMFRPMLWLSHPGVVAQTHYDTMHNVFVQVQGVKRFLLFPPGTELYSYPNIHRSYRQSQVHFEFNRTHNNSSSSSSGSSDSNVDTRFPLVHPSNTTAYQFTLSPGDVLYIPPYWQHRVESLTLSMSLSVLSPSRLEAALSEVYWENVPFGAFQKDKSLRARAVNMYLSMLVDKMPREVLNGTLSQLAQNVYETRFATLKMKHKVFAGGENSSICFDPLDANTTALFDLHRPQFESAASNIATMLTDIDAVAVIKVIFLKDYVEQLTRWVVGPEYTATFIRDCLRTYTE